MSFGQNSLSCYQSYKNEGDEIEQIFCINHTSRHRIEMGAHAQVVKDFTDTTCKLTGQKTKNNVKENANKEGHQKPDNLIVGNAGGKDADADVNATHEKQSEIAGPNSSVVNRSDIGHRNVVGQGKCQGNCNKQKS